MIDKLAAWLAIPWVRSATIVAGSAVVAYLTEVIVSRVVLLATSKTRTDLDDRIVAIVRRPIFLSVLYGGLAWAAAVLAAAPAGDAWRLPPGAKVVIFGVLKTVAVLTWSIAGMRIGAAVLRTLSARERPGGVVQPRTLPALDMVMKLVVIGSATYFVMLSWKVDVSGWLASAGILGLVIGLAAKDTLANLFAGIFIIADAPYKIGDFIVLEGGLRGQVTDIGIRSTRILTRNDVQITVPNAVIGNSKIVNETAGPYAMERVPIRVGVAYGSNVDRVREVLLAAPEGVPHVTPSPEPRVRFREFGDSALLFDLLIWIDEPVLRGRVVDRVNQRIYELLGAAGIEIPYSKHDVYIKELPAAVRPRGPAADGG